MDMITLKGKPRLKHGSAEARRLRRSGWVPAIIYGHGKGTAHFQLEAEAVSRFIHEGHHMVTIDVDGTVGEGLLKDIQFDAFGDQIVHLDFARISMDEVVETLVVVHTFGTAKGVATGGILDITHPELAIKCKARDLPDHIEIDVTDMDLADSIRVRDLVLPAGVETVLGPDEAVIILHPPRGDDEIAADETAPSEPEVIDEKKKDGEEESS